VPRIPRLDTPGLLHYAMIRGRRFELVGGGLIRSLGGWGEVKKMRRTGQDRIKSDQRILGESDFACEKKGERLYVQVAYMITDQKVHNRKFGNLLGIKDNFTKIMVSMD